MYDNDFITDDHTSSAMVIPVMFKFGNEMTEILRHMGKLLDPKPHIQMVVPVTSDSPAVIFEKVDERSTTLGKSEFVHLQSPKAVRARSLEGVWAQTPKVVRAQSPEAVRAKSMEVTILLQLELVRTRSQNPFCS